MEQKKQNLKGGTQFPSECTTIIVGPEMMADGSRIVARSEDWNAMLAKNLEIYSDTSTGAERFVALDSPFRCELPREALATPPLRPTTYLDTGVVRASIPLGSG